MNQFNAKTTGTPKGLSWWRKAALVLGLVLIGGTSAMAQTTLISPTGDGGFENGATFASNGWTVANSASVNQFVVTTINSTAPFVNRSAHTSNDGGSTATYTNTAGTVNYFYRDITVPAGETAITLSFNWFGQGESTWDGLQVFTAPTTTIPTASTTYPGSGATTTNLIGATFQGWFNLQGTVQTANIVLPGALAGTTFRLIFGWKSDTSLGTMPSVSVDNISLVSALPAGATCPSAYVPLDLTTNVPTNQVISWSGAGGAPAPSYTVYFGTSLALVTAQDISVRVLLGTFSTFYAPPALTTGTVYYWQVVPVNPSGGPPSCTVNSFTTAPPAPATCATTFSPLNGAINVPANPLVSWSGAGGSPAPTYSVYFSTNLALVTALDVSVRVLNATAASTYTPPLLTLNQTYYWTVIPSNINGTPVSCVINSFQVVPPTVYTATATGGLWSSAATWVGGVVPPIGNDISIPAGSTVTIDQAVNYRDYTIDGTLHWGGANFVLTSQGNFTISATGRFFPYTSGGTGQTLAFLGDFINNGYTNLMVSALQFGGSGAQSLGGTGTFVGTGAKGIVNSILKQGTGTLTINTTTPLVARGSLIPLQGTINSNGLLEVDNAVGNAGQAMNQRLETIVVTAMGAGLTSSPSITGTWPSGTAALWVASGAGTVNNKVVVPGGNVYLVTTAGTLDAVNPPTHTSGIVANGTAQLLWLGPVGTIGTGFQATTSVTVGTQVWYGGNLYTCTVAGIPSAAAPPVHVSGTAGSGAATFAYVGTPVQVTANYDGVSLTVRSLNFVNQGSGYHTSPPIAFLAAVGTVPVAAGVVDPGFAGAVTFLAQKQATSSIVGALPINNTTGVTTVVPGGFGRYLAAPAIGIGGPTGINFVTAQGAGWTAAPTVTFTGGTIISGTNTFNTQVANGKILSIVLTTSALYSVPPTGISIVGVGAGATAALPANCWATATTNMNANGQVVSFTVTNAGFGYIVAPTCALTPAVVGEAAAVVPTARVGLYNLTLSNFTPATINGVAPVLVNAPHTETGTGSLWPTNRTANLLTLGAGNQGLAVTGGNFTLTAATGPLVLTSGALDMGTSSLVFSNPTFLGQNAALASWVQNGSVELNGVNATTVVRNFPFRNGGTAIGSVRLSIGTGTLATGSDITRTRVTQLGAPSGITPAPVANMGGTRSYQLDILAGTVYGTGPTMQLAFDASDGLVSDNPSLYVAQSTVGIAGPWNVVSLTTGTGALPATGSRTSATTPPGPIVFAGATWFGFATNYVPPPPLAFSVTRTTGNSYQSISPLPVGDATGTLSLASGDEGIQAVPFPGGMTFNYQGLPCTGFSIHANGYIMLANASFTPPTFGSSWDNSLASGGASGTTDLTKRNVIAPFYSDLNKPSPVIYYKFVGTVATIEWYNTTFFGLAGPQMYWQIVLDGNDNSITFNYGDMQLFNGTQNVRYSYTCGLSGSFIQVPTAAGQIFQQQFANTTLFGHEYSNASNWGANGLAASPDPRSRIKFTPGVYVPPAAPVPTPPTNDDFAGAITRPALLAFPSNIAWEPGTNTTNLYSTRYATASVFPDPGCSPNTGANSKDVWFKFNASAASTTVRIYGSGGFIPRVQAYDQFAVPVGGCIAGNQGLIADLPLSGLNIGDDYYVRVYHDRVGTTALATATISGGVVNSVTVTTPGTNYSVPQQAFSYNGSNQGPILNFSGGGGTSAAGALTNPTAPSQVIPTLATSNLGFHGGAGYTSAPTVTIDSPDWGITGEFGIVVFAPVLNDDCAGAFPITSGLGCTPTVGTTGGATGSAVPVTCNGIADDDVWYQFVAVAPNTQVQVVSDVAFNAAVEVFSGTCAVLTSINCTNITGLGGTENANLTGLIIGNTYFVRVNHALNLGGSSAFTICVNHAPSCATVTAPLNGATVSSATPTLSWAGSAPIGASGYNVYLDQNLVPTTLVSPNQPGLTFIPGAALAAGTWYWRIEPINGPATNVTCAVNNFIVPSCFAPTAVAVTPAPLSTASVAFTCAGCTGTYIMEYGPVGFVPGTGATAGAGTIVTGASSPILTGTLISGNTYHFYVRQECVPGSSYSVNAGPIFYSAPPACGGNYYDNGGPGGNYTTNINNGAGRVTICPDTPGDVVLVSFTSFQVEANWDPLYVFNGPTITDPKIMSANGNPSTTPNLGTGGWWGTVAPTNTGTPGVVMSTHPTGCLTFEHLSDASIVQAGWQATVTCATPHYTCAAAGTVVCGDLKQGFTIGGTNTLPVTACPFNGAVSNSGVSWWIYDALATEDVTISTCNLATFNTRLSVFHAPLADCTVLDCISLNDNTPGCSSNTSELVLAAVGGQRYYIAVHGSGTANGTFQLSVTCAPSCAPPGGNDLCATPVILTPVLADGFGVPTVGDNSCAHAEAGTTCSGVLPVAGVWFTFNSGSNTNMTITLVDEELSGSYTANSVSFALFDGSCGGLLANSELVCDATGSGYAQSLPTLALNTNYKLLVYNTGGVGTAGTFAVLLEFPAGDDAGISSIVAPDGLVCTTAIVGSVTLTNYGANPLTTVDILYSVDLGPQQTFNWTGTPLNFNQSVVVQLPILNVTAGPHTYEATVANPNGQPDIVLANNASSSNFNSSGEAVVIVINQDRWGSETTWEIYDALEIAPIATGGPYTDLPANGTFFNSVTLCLPTDFGNCYTLRILDSFGDGMCCLYGVGTWQVQSTGGAVLLSDVFHGSGTLGGSAIYDGDQSPAVGLNPSYTGHEFCLPKGPADIEAADCNVLTNTLTNKVYALQSPGTGNYQFEFTNPDQAYRRRISVPQRYVKFSQLQTSPLVAGTIYFARARRDAANDGYANDRWGSGCDMALDISVISGCGQLINDIDLPTHSCGVTRSFGYSDKVWAQPVLGATQYRFRFVGSLDPDGPNGPLTPIVGTRQITQASYVRVLNWASYTLLDGETYNVTVEVFVNGVWSGFCGATCTVTIDNPPAFGGRDVESVIANSDVQLYPNPVRDGNVSLVLNGLLGTEGAVTVDIYDLFGKRVYTREIATEGATELSTVLELGTSLASGVYMVDITMGERQSVQRLSIQ